MRHGRSQKYFVQRIRRGEITRFPDEIVVEEPLEIRLDGNLVATTMRTPGHDYELAVGFCTTEDLFGGAAVTQVRYCAEGPASDFEYNVVTVDTGGQAPVPQPRLGNVSSSCGLCGSATLTDLATRLDPIRHPVIFKAEAIATVLETIGSQQELFARTGGLHAAAVFDSEGTLQLIREDIGRHNAVDKIVGRRVLDDEPTSSHLGLFVSGRASFEMVQKAWVAGFGTLMAVSAPSALAIDVATTANMTLVGFARSDSMNVYSGQIDQ
ncbi:MAG: formate dehydrogenase accessory sulfurtransferase FdhD [Actinomycetota bacterium]|nr:formate dehydrogenase accessory sulfurtransferase FdhD [Actinomycetota bacterium]MEE3139565.1 formate dehydrogenase accessory sulfurtransferase FdhD [Actinomycetota bacterium]